MHFPSAKTFNYQNPEANELTSSPMTRIAEQNDIKRDSNRTKRTQNIIGRMDTVAGLTVAIEGDADATPQPGDGFTLICADDILDVLRREGMRKTGVSMERLIELVDHVEYSFWLNHRSWWYKVDEMEITKRYKGGDDANIGCFMYISV